MPRDQQIPYQGIGPYSKYMFIFVKGCIPINTPPIISQLFLQHQYIPTMKHHKIP